MELTSNPGASHLSRMCTDKPSQLLGWEKQFNLAYTQEKRNKLQLELDFLIYFR